jgi:hypothetical protein
MFKNIEIDVPNETSFHVQEGRHKAVLTTVTPVESLDKKRNFQEKVRLLFEVFPEGGTPGITYMAGKNYEKKLTKDSELRQHLESWQGPDLIKQGRKFHPESLKGKEAVIEIVHRGGKNYEYPFCEINRILPPEQTMPAGPRSLPAAEHDVGL